MLSEIYHNKLAISMKSLYQPFRYAQKKSQSFPLIFSLICSNFTYVKSSRSFPASHPKRSLGQNFLVNPNTARWIVRQLEVSPGDHVIEIGPGKGILTRAFLETGARITAIEKDTSLCEYLKQELRSPLLTILEGDATDFPWQTLTDEENPAILAGNLPYNVSTQILRNLLPQTKIFKKWQFLFQKEVAERICANVGTAAYGALSVFVQSVTRPSLIRIFPPRFFSPPPKIESALVAFEMRPLSPPTPMQNKDFIRLVKAAFSHRRKMLRNNLKSLFGRDADTLESALASLGLTGTLRAQNLTVEDYLKLAAMLTADLP